MKDRGCLRYYAIGPLHHKDLRFVTPMLKTCSLLRETTLIRLLVLNRQVNLGSMWLGAPPRTDQKGMCIKKNWIMCSKYDKHVGSKANIIGGIYMTT